MENQQRNAICVYGASSNRIDDCYTDDARQLGRLIALSGHPLVCGGGKAGIMQAAIEGAVAMGGTAIGVLPEFMIKESWQHPELSRVIVTDGMHSRKETMASLSLAAIACPGGCGTFEELMEIITWRQLGLFPGQVVILNTKGYYNPLLAMLSQAIEQRFMYESHAALWHVATTPAEAVRMALEPVDTTSFPQKIH